MAERPGWTLNLKVQKRMFSFKWNSGFAISQKKKNIINLHETMNENGCNNILEVSTKSNNDLGNKLSAFNLKLNGYYLENVFQSSKIYENGGPYLDLLDVEPKYAKRDERHFDSGKLIGFNYNQNLWGLEPKTAFYDYIYILAVKNTLNNKELNDICNYDWFTDIEFNPKKSINCQARSVALLKYIIQNEEWEILKDIKLWMEFHKVILDKDS